MKKNVRLGIVFLILCAMIVSVAGCTMKKDTTLGMDDTQEVKPSISSIFVYTLNNDRDYISRMVQEFPATENLNQLILEQMMLANRSLFPRQTRLLSVEVNASSATVNFSKEFAQVDPEAFLFVNELCAISLAQGVTVQGEKISTITVLADGEPIEGFFQYPYQVYLVDHAAEENLKVKVIKLFFPDKGGNKLYPEYRLVPLMNDLDKVMMYELFAGTKDIANKTNVIPDGTQFLDLSNSGNTYTINLNSAFIEHMHAGNLTNMLAIQSIVATLTEFTVIDQVKFNVEGQTSGVLFGEISLNAPIQLNPELVEK